MSIRKRGPRSYQVRVGDFRARTLPTREAAERVDLELRLRLKMGEFYEEAPRIFGDELDAFLTRVRVGKQDGDRTVEFYERSAKVWGAYRDKHVASLRRAEVEDFITARAAEHPRSAKNELELLKRVLRDAKERGQKIDPALLAIPPIRHRPRRGRALTVSELYEFASWFPEHVSRLVLVAGQVGARQNVWFSLTDDLLDLADNTLTVPADLAKNRREHKVYLTPVEARLLREQLLVRAPGTRLVFSTENGKNWTRSGFRERVWVPAVSAAEAENPRLAGFTFHLLRHTAGSIMASLGMDPASAAERLGHSDGGALFLRLYRHLYEGEKRRHAVQLGIRVQALLDEEWTGAEPKAAESLNEAAEKSGRTWDRTRDLPRVKRALSR